MINDLFVSNMSNTAQFTLILNFLYMFLVPINETGSNLQNLQQEAKMPWKEFIALALVVITALANEYNKK